jgi:hypothetical protein
MLTVLRGLAEFERELNRAKLIALTLSPAPEGFNLLEPPLA